MSLNCYLPDACKISTGKIIKLRPSRSKLASSFSQKVHWSHIWRLASYKTLEYLFNLLHLFNLITNYLIQYIFYSIDLILTCRCLAWKFQVWALCNDYLGSAKWMVQNMLKYGIHFAYNYLHAFCMKFVFKLNKYF